ncbi:type III toxin-antitoxin system ToxN/AbiQ family toxin [Vibrio fluvialis]|nr:type III toxin-antitoxin system ToxN/AbiQ family toxin [Vibrio fluvialis]
MKFYTVTDDYIQHLKAADKNVPDNYSETRAYIGIVLTVKGTKYLAPLTSYKEKQDQIKNSTPTIFKLNEEGNLSNKLGMIQLNNMIPVTDSVIDELDVDAQKEPYKSMLQRQIKFIKKNSDKIATRATKLYRLVAESKHPHFSKVSCNFELLEAAMLAYKIPEAKAVAQEKLEALAAKFK